MKIFNWVHRMLNHKDGSAQNARKSGVTAGKTSDANQFMLENDVFSGWKGGILAIGTFGYDPLKDENEENDEFIYKQESVLENESDYQITDSEEDEEEEEDDEEVNPLMYAAYAHDYEGLMEMKMKMEEKCVALKDDFEFDTMTAKKVRTTLGELFSADSEEKQRKQSTKKGEIIKEKSKYKHRLSFAKKLIGDDARPIHKLHRLMRRMLKRKIHPDVGVNKHINPINSKVVVQMCATNPPTHSASLLIPTRDAIIG